MYGTYAVDVSGTRVRGLADSLKEERDHVALALHVHRAPAAKLVPASRQDVIHFLGNLNISLANIDSHKGYIQVNINSQICI